MARRTPLEPPRAAPPRSRISRPAGRPAISQTDLRDLFARWQQDRDQAAQEQLVERYLPLARKLARRYTGAHESVEDLMQVASFGLLKALDRFDANRGIAFSSFAVPTILGELKRYFRDLGWSIHVPRRAQELALKVRNAEESLVSRTGRSPTAAEIARYLELGIEDVLEGLEAAEAHHAGSLDAPHDDGDGDAGTLADTFGQEDAGFELVEDATTVAGAMRTISAREQHVLHLRFFEDLTQTEIAKRIGVSQMQVSRIMRRAIATLTERTLPSQPSPTAKRAGSALESDDAERDHSSVVPRPVR